MKYAMILSLVSAATLTGINTPTDPEPAPAIPAAQASQDDVIRLSAEGGLALGDFLQMAQQILGFPLHYDPREIQGNMLHFDGTVEVSRERFLAFFENLLRQQDFLHIPMGSDPVLHSICRVSPQSGRSGVYKTMARIIPPEQLAELADRSILVTTFLEPENLPARELVATLQPYFSDNFVENVRNVEGTNVIIMTGFASTLAGLAAIAEEIDGRAKTGADLPTRRNLQTVLQRLDKLEAQVRELTAPKSPGEK